MSYLGDVGQDRGNVRGLVAELAGIQPDSTIQLLGKVGQTVEAEEIHSICCVRLQALHQPKDAPRIAVLPVLNGFGDDPVGRDRR